MEISSISRRRRFAAVGLSTLLATSLVACSQSGSGDDSGGEEDFSGQSLLVTFPGSSTSFVESVDEQFLQPFAEANDMEVVANNQSTGPAQLSTQVESGRVEIGLVVTGSGGDFESAKKNDYLQKLDTDLVPVDQLAEGSYDEYGVNAWTYGTVAVWNTDNLKYSGDAPSDMTAIYDLENYPGKRCLYKYPEYGATLESALLADGVAPDELYPLDTERAFKKLESIKDDIVWWDSGAQVEQYLLDGTCDMALYYSGPISKMIRTDGAPLDFTWGKALLENVVMAVPKGTPNPAASQALIRWVIENKDAQRKFLEEAAYFPVSLKDESDLLGGDADLAKYVPSAENTADAIVEDPNYYSEHIGEVVDQFNEWVMGL